MRTTTKWVLAAMAAAALLSAGTALPEEPAGPAGGGAAAKEPPGADPREHDPAEAMKRWQAACTPGRFHRKLEALKGSWTTEMAMRPMGPGGPEMKSAGKATWSWLMDGRWMRLESEGTMMGMPMKGFGLFGYDNYKNKYTMTWVDSLTTAKLSAEGNFDGEGNLVLFGSMDEPMTGEHDKCVRYVWRFPSADKLVFEIHDLPIGLGDSKVIEVRYTRN